NCRTLHERADDLQVLGGPIRFHRAYFVIQSKMCQVPKGDWLILNKGGRSNDKLTPVWSDLRLLNCACHITVMPLGTHGGLERDPGWVGFIEPLFDIVAVACCVALSFA